MIQIDRKHPTLYKPFIYIYVLLCCFIFIGCSFISKSATPNDKYLDSNTCTRMVTPEMFGARGDGISDDTEAFNKALHYNRVKLNANATYCITEIVVPNTNSIVIEGRNSTIKCVCKDTKTPFNVVGNQRMDSEDTHFSNGTFYMKGVNIDANVRNYEIDSPPCPNGFNALALDNFKKVVIENCSFSNTLMCGIRTTICDSVIIRNCNFRNIGYDECPIARAGWQWEGISSTGYRYVNGKQSNCVYGHSSYLLVENCIFDNILNSIVGCGNTSNVFINNNKCDRLHSFFSEFHVNNNLKESIDLIRISGNHVDRQGGALISFSGSFSERVKTEIIISDNTILRFNGESLPKYHMADADVLKHLLLIYRDNGVSNVEVKYDKNSVTSVDGSTLDTYMLISGIKKVKFSNSEFNIFGNPDGMSTIIYAPFSEIEILNCRFNCQTNFSNFLSINELGCSIRNTSIDNKNCENIIAVQNFRGRSVENVVVDDLQVNKCDRLLYFANLPQVLLVRNSKINGDCGIIDSMDGNNKKIERMTIENNTMRSLNILSSISSTHSINNNVLLQ